MSFRTEFTLSCSSCLVRFFISSLRSLLSIFGLPPSFIIWDDNSLIVSSSFWIESVDAFSLFFIYSSNCLSLNASTLLTPAAIEDWLTVLNFPISPVFLTWVPPHNSVEKYASFSLPIDTTLTSSPYFSPKNARAPFSIAAFGVIILVVTSVLFFTYSFTNLSIVSSSSFVIGFIWLKSNLKRSGATSEPFCITCFPSVRLKDSWRRCVAEW